MALVAIQIFIHNILLQQVLAIVHEAVFVDEKFLAADWGEDLRVASSLRQQRLLLTHLLIHTIIPSHHRRYRGYRHLNICLVIVQLLRNEVVVTHQNLLLLSQRANLITFIFFSEEEFDALSRLIHLLIIECWIDLLLVAILNTDVWIIPWIEW